MALRVFLLGTLLASIVAMAYLLWSGLWLVILMAIGFGLLTTAITALVNLPMAVFWRELGYPTALTTAGLRFLVHPLRLLIVSRIPALVYGGLAYCICLAAILLFGSASDAIERAASMMIGWQVGLAGPMLLANMLHFLQDSRGLFLSSQLLYGRVASFPFLIIHSIGPLSFWPVAALLALSVLTLEWVFGVFAWRRMPTYIAQRT